MDIDLSPITKSEAFCDFLGINLGDQIYLQMLAHGEYNMNYLLLHPGTGEKLVMRIPMGSQMHLDNQVRYEFEALRLLEASGRTPKPLYIDDTKTAIPYGFLVMNFIPGRSLKYEHDLELAAQCLAGIHNLDIPEKTHLLTPENPLAAVLQECQEMAACYVQSSLATTDTKRLLSALLDRGKNIVKETDISAGKRCIINTELNSGNFLMDDNAANLVDWEKPIFAYPGQDLGHFLAPTTTLWKTDSILGRAEIQGFLESYCGVSCLYNDPAVLWKHTKPYFVMNCLRGVTWCSMAYVEYNSPQRVLKDAFTFQKIKTYIAPEFLERILKDYFENGVDL
ncbi:MAG: phosphotransferase [Spirochaetes bacterium]|nr:phosphotransferase [Spirochaetota bacterium]